MSRVEFKNVSLRFGVSGSGTGTIGENHVYAARDINFQLSDGARLGVIGRNGGGKSTLLSMMAGNILPQSGSITVDGERLALINRTSGLEPRATLYENAVLKAYAYKLTGQARDDFVEAVLDSAGLTNRRNSPLNTLSTGMAGRFNIALNSQIVKQVTILDEWIGTLNISSSSGSSMLNRLAREADIVVFASHNELLIRKLCNQVLVLEQGKLLYHGEDLDKGFDILSSILSIDPAGKLTLAEIEQRLGQSDGNDSHAQISVATIPGHFSATRLGAKNFDRESSAPVHVLNMGRTLVPSIQKAIVQDHASPVTLRFHPMGKRLADIPVGERICLFYRSPISRFVSGFYSRKLQGAPYYKIPWNDLESRIFERFSTPSQLIDAIDGGNTSDRVLAISAILETEHLNRTMSWFLGGIEEVLQRLGDLVIVLNSDDTESLVSSVSATLGLRLDSETLVEEEKFVLDGHEPMTASATAIFQKMYSQDYEVFGLLENLTQESLQQ